MKRIALLAAILAAAFIAPQAGAEIYQWTDANGKKVISDKPPPGQVNVQKKAPVEAAPQNDGAQPTDDQKPKGEPKASGETKEKSLADRDMEFRKRQKEQQEKEEKAKKEADEAAKKKENCDNARKQLQILESGRRVAMMNDKGERYFMEDAQRAQEIEKTRSYVDTQCK